jgi:hypothetical protein
MTAASLHNGWAVEFRRNVHMYAHHLKMTKGDQAHVIPCEDSPCGFVGIWPHDLDLETAVWQDLLAGLRSWASQSGFEYRLYTSRDHYEGNSPA